MSLTFDIKGHLVPYERMTLSMEQFDAKEIYGVDAYTVEIYPEEHKKHNISKVDLV